ncbi:hypothetical protein FGO68_gene2134 [Halteria grandinella]|uniref:Uncharacterized protein n=1 Tax=Halteria grandinella TaxID=5974 RepID=A0A8J8SXU3_HALGN|nr:hypothetical protein FGO68_gene2134 [Halteria grandinella]
MPFLSDLDQPRYLQALSIYPLLGTRLRSQISDFQRSSQPCCSPTPCKARQTSLSERYGQMIWIHAHLQVGCLIFLPQLNSMKMPYLRPANSLMGFALIAR